MYLPKIELLSHMVALFNLLKNHQTVLSIYTILHPHQQSCFVFILDI